MYLIFSVNRRLAEWNEKPLEPRIDFWIKSSTVFANVYAQKSIIVQKAHWRNRLLRYNFWEGKQKKDLKYDHIIIFINKLIKINKKWRSSRLFRSLGSRRKFRIFPTGKSSGLFILFYLFLCFFFLSKTFFTLDVK